MKRYLILDCYIDEPACLGVPPFISPYPRYIYGALIDAGIDKSSIEYLTIDDLRESEYTLHENFEHIFLVGGAVVPGRYLGARIGTLAEILKILERNSNENITIGGLINRTIKERYPNTTVVLGDIEKFAFNIAGGNDLDEFRSMDEISRWSVAGSDVVTKHPWYPNIICEIETGRGCPRLRHCSFCSEGLFKDIEFRTPENIVSEVDRLIDSGVFRFRLGRQADIIQYGTKFKEFNGDFPKPEPEAVNELFGELKERRENGSIKILNIDNGNPGSIVSWPMESRRILDTISDTVTEGDTLPFGIESFDEKVVSENGLKIYPEDALDAVRILNEAGGKRRNGIPILLPGINLIHGLRGESAETFKINYEYLSKISDQGLLVKRINIRKLQPYPDTDIYNEKKKIKGSVQKRFEFYKERIRNEIDVHMLKKIYPPGTVLRDCFILDVRQGYSLGKQISSYSITLKVPGEIQLRTFRDIVVTGHRERSLQGISLPLNINSCGQKAFEYIPGISRDKSSQMIIERPFSKPEDFEKFLEGTPEDLKEVILNNIVFE